MLYTRSDESVEHHTSRGGSHGALRVATATIGVASISPLVGGWLGGDGLLLDSGRLMTGALTGLLAGVLIWLEQHRRNGSHRRRGSDSGQNAAADETSGLVSANEPTREGEWSPDLLESSSELTKRLQAEENLRQMTEFALDALVVVDSDGEILLFNQPAEAMFGYQRTEIEGQTIEALVPIHCRRSHVADRARFRAEGRSRRMAIDRECNGLRKDGSEFPVEINLSRVMVNGETRVVVSIWDVTERKAEEALILESQARLQHGQKLENLGRLASGIAHDFNNLLGGIVNYANLALKRTEPQSRTREPLENIKKAALGMSKLSNQMLIYAGNGKAQTRPLALSHLVEELHPLVQASISKMASLRYELATDLTSIDGDAAQIKQILLNLVTNASDALQGEQGEIVVRTRLVAGESALLEGAYSPDGPTAEDSVCLEVSDTGCGMDEETRTRLFDSFFTTKGPGRGLGLSSVLEIVRRHRAHILVQSALGEGTRVKVLFPISRSKLPPIEDVASSTPSIPTEREAETS